MPGIIQVLYTSVRDGTYHIMVTLVRVNTGYEPAGGPVVGGYGTAVPREILGCVPFTAAKVSLLNYRWLLTVPESVDAVVKGFYNSTRVCTTPQWVQVPLTTA